MSNALVWVQVPSSARLKMIMTQISSGSLFCFHEPKGPSPWPSQKDRPRGRRIPDLYGVMLIGEKMEEKEIDEIVRMLDDKTRAEISRIGICRVETEREDFVRDVHHHGRCDVGSPFADGSIKNFCE